jgi:hypothetical protein
MLAYRRGRERVVVRAGRLAGGTVSKTGVEGGVMSRTGVESIPAILFLFRQLRVAIIISMVHRGGRDTKIAQLIEILSCDSQVCDKTRELDLSRGNDGSCGEGREPYELGFV